MGSCDWGHLGVGIWPGPQGAGGSGLQTAAQDCCWQTALSSGGEQPAAAGQGLRLPRRRGKGGTVGLVRRGPQPFREAHSEPQVRAGRARGSLWAPTRRADCRDLGGTRSTADRGDRPGVTVQLPLPWLLRQGRQVLEGPLPSLLLGPSPRGALRRREDI